MPQRNRHDTSGTVAVVDGDITVKYKKIGDALDRLMKDPSTPRDMQNLCNKISSAFHELYNLAKGQNVNRDALKNKFHKLSSEYWDINMKYFHSKEYSAKFEQAFDIDFVGLLNDIWFNL